MDFIELESLLNALGDKYKREAEQVRLVMYSIFQSQSTKKLKVTDIMKFDWDLEQENIDTNKLLDKENAIELLNKLK